MASFTSVGDTATASLKHKGDQVAIALSGTYNMVIQLQKEMGSPGSGAWQKLKEWSTANATVAYNHVASEPNESLRLIVITDTSGTCTATIADNLDKIIKQWKSPSGDVLMQLTQEGLEVAGAFRRISSDDGGSAIVSVSASTTLTAEDHAGKTLVTGVATTMTLTLPAATATGNIYKVFCGITATGDLIIQAASASDVILGGVSLSTDVAGVTMLTAATTDTITMNGSTTGGLIGSWVTLQDVASGQWMLDGFLCTSGAEGTPFSAAV